MFLCLDLSDSDSIAFLSLIVSAGTLILGMQAYDKFLVKKAQEKQLEIILELLSCIHDSKNKFEEHSKASGVAHVTTIQSYSIFEMIELPQFNEKFEMYFFYVEDGLKWEFFLKFYSNPLLPKKIATALRKFDIRNRNDYVRSSVFNKGALIIGNISRPISGTKVFYVTEFNGVLENTVEFKKAVTELKSSIIRWLKDYGINDINLLGS